MGRQTHTPGLAARWAAGILDLDPYRLPVSYSLPLAGAIHCVLGAWDRVSLTAETVRVEQRIAGLRLGARVCPVSAFLGVAVRMTEAPRGAKGVVVSINLHHADPTLCLPLHMAADVMEANARWQSWGKVLKLPLLAADGEGVFHDPVPKFGKLEIEQAWGRSAALALEGRQSRISAARKVGAPAGFAKVGGREIIART